MNTNWYEVWADEGQEIPYILLLRPTSGGFEIIDVIDGKKKAFESPSYEDAKMWLVEDEFTLVARKELDL